MSTGVDIQVTKNRFDNFMQQIRKDLDDYINQGIELKIMQIVSKREANGHKACSVKDVLAFVSVLKSIKNWNLHSMTNVLTSAYSFDVVIRHLRVK